jgi:hypothetical protein
MEINYGARGLKQSFVESYGSQTEFGNQRKGRTASSMRSLKALHWVCRSPTLSFRLVYPQPQFQHGRKRNNRRNP